MEKRERIRDKQEHLEAKLDELVTKSIYARRKEKMREKLPYNRPEKCIYEAKKNRWLE